MSWSRVSRLLFVAAIAVEGFGLPVPRAALASSPRVAVLSSPASPADSVRLLWRHGSSLERKVLPAGAIALAGLPSATFSTATLTFPDAPRQAIVRFRAPPAAATRGGGAALESARASYLRFSDDVSRVAAEIRASLGDRAADFRVRHRLETSYNGVAMTASAVLLERIRRLDYVTGVFPDDSVHARLDQSLTQIQVDALRSRLPVSGAGVQVGIIDTGIDYLHPALGGCLGAGCRVIGGWDFVNGDADPMDDNGHGTHVAGIVGGDGAGLSGVAPGVRFLAYKVLGASGSGLQSDVIAAIDRALDPDGNPQTDDAVDVINLSLGGSGGADDPVSQAVDEAVAAGVVCVVAAGNSGAEASIAAPGAARRAITVGAVDALDHIAAFSSRGPALPDDAIKPDVVAPGVGIVSTWLGGGSVALSGTSMATPHVTGVVALLRELYPTWTPQTVKAALMNTAADLGVGSFQQGAGRIDALGAAIAGVTIEPGSLSFGLAPTGVAQWSVTKTLTIRADSSHVRTLTWSVASDLPAGSSLQITPATLTLAPGETRSVIATLTLDRAPRVETAPHAYGGTLRADLGDRALRIPFAVLHATQLVLDVGDGGLVIVHDRSRVAQSIATSGSGTRRLFVRPGTYDVVAALGIQRVVREGIVVADSQHVTLRVADAVHTMERACIDERGNRIDPPIGIEYLRHRESGLGIVSLGTMPSISRFSTISSTYDWEWHRLSYGQEPVTYDFTGFRRGIDASAVMQNAPGDLRRVTLSYRVSPGIPRVLPVRWVSDGPRGTPSGGGFAISSIATLGWLPPLVAPFTQQYWYMPPPDLGVHFRSRRFEAYPDQGTPYPSGVPDLVTPYLVGAPGGPLSGFLPQDDIDTVCVVPDGALEIGLGPPTWFGSFHNRTDLLRVSPRGGASGWIVLAQQGDWRDHSAMPYVLEREGVAIETGAMGGELVRPLNPGRHTLTLTHDRYWVGDQRCRATVTASFDSRAADPDPPSVRRLACLANGTPSDRIEGSGTNLVVLRVDDAGGIDSVKIAARPVSSPTWTPLDVSRSGDRFEATLPASVAGALALRVEATDPSGNRIACTYEPAVTVVAPADRTPPSVELIEPNGGESWSLGVARTIRWSASDDVAVSGVDLALSMDGGSSFPITLASGLANTGTAAWTPTSAGATFRVRVLARDATGNLAVDQSAADFAVVDSNRVQNGSFEAGLTGWMSYGSASLSQASEGRSGTRSLRILASSSSTFGCDDQPNWIGTVAGKGALYRISAWVKSSTGSRGKVRLRLYEYLGSTQQGSTAYSKTVTLSATWSQVTLDYVTRTAGSTLSLRITDEPAASRESFLVDDVSIKLMSAPADAAPVIAAPASVAAAAGIPLSFVVSAIDVDGPAIAALTPSPLPAGATFTVNASRTQGTFAWTPTASDVRGDPYVVGFTASNTRSATATTSIVVRTAPPNLCGNGDFESGVSGWGTYGSAALTVVPGGRAGNALRVSGSSSFGADDVPDWLPGPLVKSDVYRIACWVKRVTTGGTAGSVKVRVYELVGSTQQGSTAYSATLGLTSAWQQLIVLYTVRASGSHISLRITDAASSSESFLIDDVTIERTGGAALGAADAGGEGVSTPAVFAASFAPNPARADGVLALTTTRAGPARVVVLDVSGRRVRVLLDARHLEPGTYRLPLDRDTTGRPRLSAGVYFFHVQAGEGELQGRVVLLP